MRSVNTKKKAKKKPNSSSFIKLGQFISNLFVYKQANRRGRTTTTVVRKSTIYQGIGLSAVTAICVAFWYDLPQQAYESMVNKTLNLSAKAGFRVEEILVAGRQIAPSEKILEAVQMTASDPIFKRSVGDIQKSLQELSWIRSAHVERHLPNTIYIKVEERKPIALWQHQKLHYLVDAEGVIISSDNLQLFSHLPIVVGGDAPVHAPKILALLEKFPQVKKQVTAIIRVSGRRWNIQLDRATDVKLPEQKPEEALARLNLLLEQKKIDTTEVKTVDLRLPNKMIVGLTPAAEIRLKGKGKPV